MGSGKYTKLDGVWYKGICKDCGSLVQHQNAKRCMPCSLIHRASGIKRPDEAGDKHHNWQGGKTEESKAFRNSLEYRVWRKRVFERDQYTCQNCDQIGGELNADHIKPFALYTELRLDLNNGRTLCRQCHLKTPTWGRKAISYAS